MVDAAQINAGMRHVYTASGTAITVLGALAVLPPDQVQPAIQAMHEAVDAATQFVGALAKLWPILGPVIIAFAAKSGFNAAGVKEQLASLLNKARSDTEVKNEVLNAVAESVPGVKAVVTDVATAQATPSNKVIAAV